MKPNYGLPRLRLRARDRKRCEILKHVQLVQRIQKQLEKASPRSAKRTIGELAVDIGDLISVGRAHWDHVNQLLKMSFPKDRTAFRKLLAQFDVNLLFENQWHLSSLKRLLPRLVRDAYRSSNESKIRRARGGRSFAK
ncbi:MAG: hypothetical protein WAN12_11815 [Candidatus Acidiferrum sp.]